MTLSLPFLYSSHVMGRNLVNKKLRTNLPSPLPCQLHCTEIFLKTSLAAWPY